MASLITATTTTTSNVGAVVGPASLNDGYGGQVMSNGGPATISTSSSSSSSNYSSSNSNSNCNSSSKHGACNTAHSNAAAVTTAVAVITAAAAMSTANMSFDVASKSLNGGGDSDSDSAHLPMAPSSGMMMMSSNADKEHNSFLYYSSPVNPVNLDGINYTNDMSTATSLHSPSSYQQTTPTRGGGGVGGVVDQSTPQAINSNKTSKLNGGSNSSNTSGGRLSALRNWLKQNRWRKKDKHDSKGLHHHHHHATTPPTSSTNKTSSDQQLDFVNNTFHQYGGYNTYDSSKTINGKHSKKLNSEFLANNNNFKSNNNSSNSTATNTSNTLVNGNGNGSSGGKNTGVKIEINAKTLPSKSAKASLMNMENAGSKNSNSTHHHANTNGLGGGNMVDHHLMASPILALTPLKNLTNSIKPSPPNLEELSIQEKSSSEPVHHQTPVAPSKGSSLFSKSIKHLKNATQSLSSDAGNKSMKNMGVSASLDANEPPPPPPQANSSTNNSTNSKRSLDLAAN